ncbi:helix-turn-helix domain-containing protein [Leuconostoc mesenteroides]|uniref:helix-turn-helix domain-containing protein n=1 Tax=Leuconostoc mesenteroides TaxID=1245 RepID=UPI000CF89C4C|nr:helix-turn-helix domain-containing protein [Leuconostoc mesenteroides]SPE66197.1 Xylose operon regulatory protein [Leuconostoc mesenteroides]
MTNKNNYLNFLKHINKVNKTNLFSNSGNLQPIAIKLTQGLDLVIHDYSFDRYYGAITFSDQVLRLDFSYNGSVNLIKNNQETIFLEPDFLKIAQSFDDNNHYSSVSGQYQGITLLINRQKVSDDFIRLVGNDQLIDSITKYYLSDQDYILIKTEFIERFFKDFEAVEVTNQLQFLRLKIAELLLYLNSDEAHEAILPKTYFPTRDIKKIYAIHGYLLNHIGEKLTLQQLARQYDIGQTTMQKLFKATYYQSIHSFLMSARLEYACALLKDSQASITFIANEVGYMNTSKFSAFFKKEKQMTPKMYRQLYKN